MNNDLEIITGERDTPKNQLMNSGSVLGGEINPLPIFRKQIKDYGEKLNDYETKLGEVNKTMQYVVYFLMFMVAGMIIGLLIAIWQSNQSRNYNTNNYNPYTNYAPPRLY